MNSKSSQILCWNCEEIVNRYALKCPYCKADLRNNVESSSVENPFTSSTSNNPSSIHGTPPFTRSIPLPAIFENSPELEPVRELATQNNPLTSSDSDEHPTQYPSHWVAVCKTLIPIVLVLSGSVFFLFGLTLKFFSQEGQLILRWDASWWPYCLSCAVLSLTIGWIYLPQFEDEM